MKEGLKNFFHINKNGRGLVTFLDWSFSLVSPAPSQPAMLQKLSRISGFRTVAGPDETEYLHVGTAEIENPVIDDFKKLIVRLDAGTGKPEHRSRPSGILTTC
jgi:hypothetical protein